MERPCSGRRVTLLLAFRLAFGLTAGLAFGLTAGLAFTLAAGLAAALPLALAVGLALGLALGLTLGLTLGNRVGWADTHGDAERRDRRGELEGVTPAHAGLFRGLLVPIRHRSPLLVVVGLYQRPQDSIIIGTTEKYYRAWP